MASKFQVLDDVFSDVRYLTNKDSNTLTDADLLRIANKYYLLFAREAIALREDLYAEISFTDLVADQREYPLPTDDTSSTYGGGLIKLQRVEINYDGTSGGWYVADPISYQEIPGPTVLDADINNQFEQTNPKYAFKDRSLWIFPIPESTDDVASDNQNLYIYWIKRKGELAATDVPDIPKDFLGVLSWGMLIDVYQKFGRTNDAQLAQKNWDIGIAKMKQLEQGPDQEQPYIFKRIGENYK